jgi:hypothetical protein
MQAIKLKQYLTNSLEKRKILSILRKAKNDDNGSLLYKIARSMRSIEYQNVNVTLNEQY